MSQQPKKKPNPKFDVFVQSNEMDLKKSQQNKIEKNQSK